MENTMESLEEVLLDIINKTVEATGSATDFIVEQTPEVVQQLLLWKASISCLLFTVGVLLLITSYKAWRAFVAELAAPSDYDLKYNKEKYTDYDGAPQREFVMVLSMVVGVTSGMFGFAGVCNLAWLQILIAPKVYLIEYAASLVH